LGEYVAFETYLIFITLPTRMLGFMVSAMLRTDASMERVHAIIDAVPDITSPPRAASHSPVSGRVDFEDVSFGYTHESSTLTDLAFTIEAEETVGIIGATGCGKSTLISLIPRFYDPQRGRVLIDGHDVRQWELSALRRQIGIVFQDTFLFSGTLRDNIAYANPDTDDEDVARVARLAALDEFIQQLPEGYDTVVGERGERLSGGQQQRLSIARTLLWQPRILLLDDCTSSLDTHTEYQIQQNLESERKGRTTIIIAQRASALSTADRVFVLESGRVVETGTPSSLARDTGSLYARLRASQGPSGTDDPLPTTPEGVP
ncbi:MAG: ABC transporter ATP-binding protein, partial [Armatimonadetes bacterium CG_4_10_14_3_um_filter_59_10]